jgi:hypothetical protein
LHSLTPYVSSRLRGHLRLGRRRFRRSYDMLDRSDMSKVSNPAPRSLPARQQHDEALALQGVPKADVLEPAPGGAG